MSISKSYNKQTGIHYAYETTYEWDEDKQKKIQRRRCIGKFDPDTGDIIPNGKVGRPTVIVESKHISSKELAADKVIANNISTKSFILRLNKVESRLIELSSEIDSLCKELASIQAELKG